MSDNKNTVVWLGILRFLEAQGKQTKTRIFCLFRTPWNPWKRKGSTLRKARNSLKGKKANQKNEENQGVEREGRKKLKRCPPAGTGAKNEFPNDVSLGRATGDGPEVTEPNLRFPAVFCESQRFSAVSCALQILEFQAMSFFSLVFLFPWCFSCFGFVWSFWMFSGYFPEVLEFVRWESLVFLRCPLVFSKRPRKRRKVRIWLNVTLGPSP